MMMMIFAFVIINVNFTNILLLLITMIIKTIIIIMKIITLFDEGEDGEVGLATLL